MQVVLFVPALTFVVQVGLLCRQKKITTDNGFGLLMMVERIPAALRQYTSFDLRPNNIVT